jgi:hypothetical protein
MGKEQINSNLRRRMLGDDGFFYYFCRNCGTYLPEINFYKSKTGPFKISTQCKLHYSKKDKNESDDIEMEYLKLDPLQDEDFQGVQRLLETLGYKFGVDTPPVWIQFNTKHNIK